MRTVQSVVNILQFDSMPLAVFLLLAIPAMTAIATVLVVVHLSARVTFVVFAVSLPLMLLLMLRAVVAAEVLLVLRIISPR